MPGTENKMLRIYEYKQKYNDIAHYHSSHGKENGRDKDIANDNANCNTNVNGYEPIIKSTITAMGISL